MLFADLVATSAAVGATRSRKEKTETLAELLRRLEAAEVIPAIAFLIGESPEGRVGVGWAGASKIKGSAPAPSLEVRDIATLFSDLAATSGAGSQSRRGELLDAVAERATFDEGDFLRRLFMGDLGQGALAGVMTEAVAKASGMPAKVIRRAAMLSGSLIATAHIALTGSRDAVEAIELSVMQPVLPMLASTSTSASAAIDDLGEASVQWKLDGIRIQVHRRGDEVLVVTRNLNDVTDRLPEVVALVRSFDCESVVLDGEALGWFGDDGPESFQDTASRFGRESADEHQFSLTAKFFDILQLDGRALIDDPLRSRLEALEKLAGDHAMPGIITDEPEQAEAVFVSAVDQGHEGVMVKAIDSTYDAGRRGKAWRKVKPVHTLDLVVLAVEWGSGRRQGWLSNLHLGARLADAGDETAEFVMVGKTFKGLTDELLEWQTQELWARQSDPPSGPNAYIESRGNVVYVRPELVVEIALDAAQRSTRYPGGVALRFARVKRYRTDKSPTEADTLAAVRNLL